MARVTRSERRLGTLKSSLTMQLDDDGQLMIKCAPMFKRELRKILREIEEGARRRVLRQHEKTGKLRRSIHARPVKQAGPHRISGSVTAGSRLAPYARYVHDGTTVHEITPRPGRRSRNPAYPPALKFPGPDGKMIYRRRVLHPGNKGSRFLTNAAYATVRKYGGTIKRRDGSIIPS